MSNKKDFKEIEEQLEAKWVGNLGRWEWDYPTGKVKVNKKKIEALGYNENEIDPDVYGFTEMIHPDDYEDTMQNMRDHLSGKTEAYEVEYRIRTKNGAYRWFHDRGVVSERQEDGTPKTVSGIVFDITQRKETEEKLAKSLEEKSMLLREIHHRIKNNLSMISSIIHMHADTRESQGEQNFLREIEARIISMGLVHEQLYKSTHFTSIKFNLYVKTLAEHVLTAVNLAENSIHLELDVENIAVSSKRAIYLGLIISELIVNSAKYAFEQNTGGRISISITQKDDTIVFIYQDNGPGLPEGFDPKKSKSLGFRLIESLTASMDGTYSTENQNGMKLTIAIPGAQK
ncbi:MAG: sensor histidine kinase [Spirochaetia bacterium]